MRLGTLAGMESKNWQAGAFPVNQEGRILDSTGTEAYTKNRFCNRRIGYIVSMNGEVRYGEDVALFIDWENFKISLASGNRTPNVSALKEEVSNHGRVVVAKAYADWVTRAPELKGASQFINDPPGLYATGIEPVYVPTRLPWSGDSPRTFRVKNSVDVKMTADCIECAHSYPNITTFVLVSGDSDFIHVINTLRTMGKRVIIIGVSWSTSRRLADSVDGLVLYDVDVDPITPVDVDPITPVEPAHVAIERAPARLTNPTRQQLPDVIRAIADIVRSERQAGRTPLLTSLKQRLMRRIPGFDEKKLGFSGFKKLMQRVAQEGEIKLVTVGLVDWILMSDEPDPEEVIVDESGAEETTAGLDRGNGVSDFVESAAVVVQSKTPVQGPAPFGLDNHRVVDTPAFEPEAEYAIEEESETPDLSSVVSEALAQLDFPQGVGDDMNGQRVSDLIIAAHTLEEQEGANRVAFNFLVTNICQALTQGMEAEHEEIVRRWGPVYSRTYVTKMVRSLDSGGLFHRGWHTFKDETTGRRKRQRTFNLDREHVLVQAAMEAHLGPPINGSESPQNQETAEFQADLETRMADIPVIENRGAAQADQALESQQRGSVLVMEQLDSEQNGPKQEDAASGIGGRVLKFFARS